MASSGNLNTTGYEGRYLTFSWTQKNQSIGDNQTTISWTLKGGGVGQAGYYESGNFKVTIAGNVVYSSASRIKLYNGTTVASGTFVLTHDSNGEKKFTASVEAGIYYYAVNCNGSKEFTLNTIARASQPSCITWPENTVEVGYFGDEISIYMNRKSSAFTHTVRYYNFHGASGVIAENVGTYTTWTIPEELMNRIPSYRIGRGFIFVDTYSAGKLIGSKSCEFRVKVRDEIRPTVTINVADVSNTASMYGFLVKGLSTIRVTATATAGYGSQVTSYATTVGADLTKFEGSPVDIPIREAGTLSVITSVKDKRDRSNSEEKSIQVCNYIKPTIEKFTAERCDVLGNACSNGEYVKLTYQGGWSTLSDKNTFTLRLNHKKTTDTQWQEIILTPTYASYIEGVYVIAAETGSSYEYELLFNDNHYSDSRTTTIGTIDTLMHWAADGRSFALGKISEKSGWLENNLPTENSKELVQKGNSYAFSSNTNTEGYVLMVMVEAINVAVDSPITFVFARRNTLRPMSVYLKLKMTARGPDIESITYEGDDYDTFGVKLSESMCGIYVKKASNDDVITLQNWYTTTHMQDRVEVIFPGTIVEHVPEPYYKAMPSKMQSILDYVYPVNSIYISYSHTDPAVLFGGTWQRLSNAFLWGCNADAEIGVTGGERTHVLTSAEMPSHSHDWRGSQNSVDFNAGSKHIPLYGTDSYFNIYGQTGKGPQSAGGGQPHNNMPPYIQVSMWRRVS